MLETPRHLENIRSFLEYSFLEYSFLEYILITTGFTLMDTIWYSRGGGQPISRQHNIFARKEKTTAMDEVVGAVAAAPMEKITWHSERGTREQDAAATQGKQGRRRRIKPYFIPNRQKPHTRTFMG